MIYRGIRYRIFPLKTFDVDTECLDSNNHILCPYCRHQVREKRNKVNRFYKCHCGRYFRVTRSTIRKLIEYNIPELEK